MEEQQYFDNSTLTGKENLIRLPVTLSVAERAEKSWKPTLIPITRENEYSSDGQLYQTVDGRELPHLVSIELVSDGNPYMILIHVYNRMCILRREELRKTQSDQLENKSSINSSEPTI